METFPLEPFKVVIDGIKKQAETPINSAINAENAIPYAPGIASGNFPVRRIINQAKFGVVPFESEDIWLCTTCRNCVQRCPRGVEIIDVMRAMRRVLVPDGVVPASIPNLRSVMTSLASVGNPWGQEPNDRANWAKELGVKEFSEGTEVLYFPCCYPSYEPRLRKVAQATVNILNKAGVNFGILGPRRCAAVRVSAKRAMRHYSNAWPGKTSRLLSKAG